MDLKNKLSNFLTRGIWEADLSTLTGYRAFIIKTLRLSIVAIKEFTEGQLTLRAMSLVYTTLLSIVPILAISFSVLKAFGVHNEILEPFMLNFLAPLGDKGAEITSQIIGFVENMKVGVLGSLGLGLLFYTVVSVIQKVEKSFNAVWRIKKTRTLSRRFSDYLSVIIIGPVLIFIAIGLTASVMSNTIVQKVISIEPFGTLFYLLMEKSPYFIVCAAFTFLYIFIPNTKVKIKSALVGGVIAGILWETAGWAFASFIVTSTKYAAIYSGFAILIMFMLWLYLSWLILLVGAQISFYHQYPHFLTANKDVFTLSNRLRERITFMIMYFIGYNYFHNQKHWTLDGLVNRLELPVDTIQDILDLLEKDGLILETGDDPPAYIPARSIEKIRLNDLLNCVRIAEKETLSLEKRVASVPDVDTIISTLDIAIDKTLGEQTLRDLVVSRTEN